MMRNDVWIFSFLFLLSAFLMISPRHPVNIVGAVLTTQHRASHMRECDALLQFGNSFTVTNDASYYCDEFDDEGRSFDTSYPKTASWKNGTDCCLWNGVTCHSSTSSVIGLDLSCSRLRGPLRSNSTLFSLPSLRRLNLAGNDFERSRISHRFGVFGGMTHLNFSLSNFSGPVPLDMISQHLSTLISLDLSENYQPTIEDDRSFTRLLRNLTQLRELVLDGVDMSKVSPISLTNLSSSLTSLSLRGVFLDGIFPMSIFRLPNLRRLSLTWNFGLSGTLPQTNWTSPLVFLDVSQTNFHGSIPASLGTLTSLNFLDLSCAQFTGPIPLALGNLSGLARLDLSSNELNGTVDFEMFAMLKNIQYLSLEWNNLNVSLQNNGNYSFPRLQVLKLHYCGLTKFPYFLRSSKELAELDLSGNIIQGGIPEWVGRMGTDTLKSLVLSSNNSTGEIPSSICQLSSLQFLDLNDNNLNGTIPRCLGNLSSLIRLDFRNNLLQGPLPRSLANCTSMEILSVSYNRIRDTFPSWLNATLQGMRALDLRSNNFHGDIEIPIPPRLEEFGISNNNFGGRLPVKFAINSSAVVIDLSDNNFEGPLPIPRPIIYNYLTSDNKFSGDIPLELCNATQLDMIILSNNGLTGAIPRCFRNFSSSLSVLDLRANNFVGEIPKILFPGEYLRTIRLSQNQLGGTLPRSLAQCKYLEVLDVSENQLVDHFPYWLETLPNLQVLDLRSNKFYGPVDGSKRTSHPFPELRIFDLSDNRFSDRLPAEYMAKLRAMKNVKTSYLQYMEKRFIFGYYEDSIVVVMKGLEMELVKILTVFTTIDFSSNFFEGEIPEAIGDLKALRGLNFSHNNLTGNIPSSIGNLVNLEWLDLSSNKLNGEIPRGLADLSFLSWLNLSNNELVGPIPRSTQFDTFNYSFDGNPGLCGHPLPKPCGADTHQSPPLASAGEGEEEIESGHWIEWRAVPMGYGCGLVFGISAMYIMLETGRPGWLMRMVDRIIHRIKNRLKKNSAPRNQASRRSTRGQ